MNTNSSVPLVLPIFSLVMATYGRSNELLQFLLQLHHQIFSRFELIVVDQNPDDRLAAILEPYRGSFPLIHIRCDIGQSRARNLGLQTIRGEIVAFPDDDCWYPPGLLHKISQRFDQKIEVDGIACRITDDFGNDYPGFSTQPGPIKKCNVWGRGSGPGTFFRRSVVDAVGKFDETLGAAPGNRWASSEDIDYLLRALEHGFRIDYEPDLIVHHPNPLRQGYAVLIDRALDYGSGMGRVWHKHRFPIHYVFYRLSRSLGGAIISFLKGNPLRARYQWLSFIGKWYGWHDRA